MGVASATVRKSRTEVLAVARASAAAAIAAQPGIDVTAAVDITLESAYDAIYDANYSDGLFPDAGPAGN